MRGGAEILLDDLKQFAGDILAFRLLDGQHPHFDRAVAEGDLDDITDFDGIAGLGRLIVDHHAAGIGDLVGQGTPLDQAADLKYLSKRMGFFSFLLTKNAPRAEATGCRTLG